jgi:folylpolyglutamate synthase/dihydropteroate synthase
MTYSESVRFLYSLGNEVQTAKLGLDRITRLLEAMGSPHRAGRFVHVAGTNGKGSTCAMIESGLRAVGVRTGLYTSPHLTEPTERIQIAGQAVSETQFAQAFTEVHEVGSGCLWRAKSTYTPLTLSPLPQWRSYYSSDSKWTQLCWKSDWVAAWTQPTW